MSFQVLIVSAPDFYYLISQYRFFFAGAFSPTAGTLFLVAAALAGVLWFVAA